VHLRHPIQHDRVGQNSGATACDPAGPPPPDIGHYPGRDLHQKTGDMVHTFQYSQFEEGKPARSKIDHPQSMGKIQGGKGGEHIIQTDVACI
jgi:hypothetical protein